MLILLVVLLASCSQAQIITTHELKAEVKAEVKAQECMIPISSTLVWPKSCSEAKRETITGIPQRVLDWGSGGLGGHAWRYSDTLCNDFLTNLVHTISTYSPSISLTPHDLFHAHMIGYNTKSLAYVFHAKEYPWDLEEAKNYYQVESDKFFSTDSYYQDRNFIYFSKATDFAQKNTLYLVHDKGFCHHWFDIRGGNNLSEELLARDMNNGHKVGDVNIFVPETLKNIAYNFGEQEEVLSGKSQSWRTEANRAFNEWLAQMNQPVVYMLTGH